MRLSLLLFLLAAVLSGQSLTSLNGTVTDSTGSVVPGAKVQLENLNTAARRATEADAAGLYSFPQLTPGNYKIAATASGFSTATIADVRLLVNTPATVNIRLEVGAVSQAVEVTAEAQQVNTTDATIGNAFGARPILELPFEARNVVGLLALQPGVAFIGEGQTDSRNGAVNGGRSDQANVTLDGVDVNDEQERSAFTSVLRVTLDSVQEFRVTTTNANADMGRSSGAQIALITKSGTNEMHGSLYEYHRNTATTANSFFNNAARPYVPRPKLIRNTFGAAAGGPLKKNRLFYFANFEGRRDAKEGAADRVVPTAGMRQGILQYQRTDGSYASLGPNDIKSIDPLHIGVDPAVLKVFQSYPLPNNFNSGDGINTAGFRFKASQPLRYNTYIARLDWNPSDSGRHNFFLRGNLQNDHSESLPQFPGDPANSVDLSNSKGLAAGYNAVITPALVGTFRYGFTRQGVENSGLQTASAISFFGIADRYGLSTAAVRIAPVHNPTQDFTWTHGPHSVQFGAVERWIANQRSNYGHSFHSGQTRAGRLKGSGSALDLPDLATRSRDSYRSNIVNLLGLISTASANYNYDLKGNVQPVGAPVLRDFRGEEYELYVQDTWRVNRALSVTGGLRYSLMPAIHEANGYQVSPTPALGEWFDQRGGMADQGRPMNQMAPIKYIPSGFPGGRPLYENHKKNFAPRLALAYSPQGDSGWQKLLFGGPGKTSIRAGWGMFYELFGQSLMRSSDANSFGLQSSLDLSGSSLTESTAPRFTGLYDMPASLVPPPPKQTFPTLATGNRGRGIDSTLVPPYTMNMNFTIGREFGGGFFVQGSYVGRLSRRTLVQEEIGLPADLKDPASGMTMFEASRKLALLAKAGTPVAQVGGMPYWENLWPGAAGKGLTATQAVYQQFVKVGGDYATAMENIDRNCDPSCSKFGKYAIFDPQFVSYPAWRSIGGGNYHAMQWTVRKRFSSSVQFDFNYTWSKSIDLASKAERDSFSNGGIVTNGWKPGLRRAVSDYDMTQQWNANFVAELPFGRGKKYVSGAGRALDALVGGWQVSGIYRQTTGLPVSVDNGQAWPTSWEWRVNATQIGASPERGSFKDAPAVTGPPGPNVFANPKAALNAYDFTLPGEVGQRNGIRGDGYFTIDTNVSKRFKMPYSERHGLQFRWEVFNLTNSVRFDVRSLSISLTSQGSFGRYSDVLTSPRVMQFGMRYEF